MSRRNIEVVFTENQALALLGALNHADSWFEELEREDGLNRREAMDKRLMDNAAKRLRDALEKQ